MIEKNTEEVADKSAEIGRGFTKIYLSPLRLMWNNFLGGIAWGFGVVLGGTIVAALVLFLLSKLGSAPIIGEFISNIINSVQYYQRAP